MLHAARTFLDPSSHPPPTNLSYSSSMNPFDAAEPAPGEPTPPPYELSPEYETKISEALQRSLHVSQSRPPSASRATPAWETWDENAFEAAQAAGRQSRGGGSETGRTDWSMTSPMRSMSSDSPVGSGASGSKEMPSWLGDDGRLIAGRRSAPGGVYSPATSRPSRTSAQTTSPIEQVSRNRLRHFDEEAGIDNPPPSFTASRSDRLGMSGPSYSLDTPPTSYRQHRSPSASRGGPPLSPTSSSSSSSSRHLYTQSDATQPRSPSNPPLPARHSLPPPHATDRQRRGSHGAQALSVNSHSPHLKFDPSVAYQNNYNSYSTPPHGAVNAASLYRYAEETASMVIAESKLTQLPIHSLVPPSRLFSMLPQPPPHRYPDPNPIHMLLPHRMNPYSQLQLDNKAYSHNTQL